MKYVASFITFVIVIIVVAASREKSIQVESVVGGTNGAAEDIFNQVISDVSRTLKYGSSNWKPSEPELKARIKVGLAAPGCTGADKACVDKSEFEIGEIFKGENNDCGIGKFACRHWVTTIDEGGKAKTEKECLEYGKPCACPTPPTKDNKECKFNANAIGDCRERSITACHILQGTADRYKGTDIARNDCIIEGAPLMKQYQTAYGNDPSVKVWRYSIYDGTSMGHAFVIVGPTALAEPITINYKKGTRDPLTVTTMDQLLYPKHNEMPDQSVVFDQFILKLLKMHVGRLPKVGKDQNRKYSPFAPGTYIIDGWLRKHVLPGATELMQNMEGGYVKFDEEGSVFDISDPMHLRAWIIASGFAVEIQGCEAFLKKLIDDLAARQKTDAELDEADPRRKPPEFYLPKLGIPDLTPEDKELGIPAKK